MNTDTFKDVIQTEDLATELSLAELDAIAAAGDGGNNGPIHVGSKS